MKSRLVCGLLSLGGVLGFQSTANASFHLMQIEQLIGSVNGDTTAQALQLRMRATFQNNVQNGKIIVVDPAGLNPITVVDMGNFVPNSALGSRVLIASATFGGHTTPAAIPDFIMTNTIPASYLAAGSIMFQRDAGGGILWRLSWGGAAYTGPTTGELTNDDDGDFGAPVPGSLPSCGAYAWLFKNAANAKSTNNAADYRLTSEQNEPFFNNAGASFAVSAPVPSIKLATIDATASEAPATDTGKFRVTRSGAGGCFEPALTVLYAVTGTATNGTDYTRLRGTLNILGGATTGNITVKAINDTVPEGPETAIVTLSTNSAYTLGLPKTGTVTIQSNE